MGAKLNSIQNITHKTCPKCGKDMYLGRWVDMFTCEKCDMCIDITKEERKLITKFEEEHGLSRSARRKK
jgi:ribosomal protein S27AE